MLLNLLYYSLHYITLLTKEDLLKISVCSLLTLR